MSVLKKIQNDLLENGLDGVLLYKSDPYLSGYFPPYKTRLEQICGFKGSAGAVLVMPQGAVLFVDSRYTEQAKQETDVEVLEVPTQTTVSKWIGQNLKNKKIVFDADIHSYYWYEEIKKTLKESALNSPVPL